MTLRALALNCTLKGGDAPSSTAVLLEEVLAALADHGVEGGEIVRVVDHDVKPGVSSDEGDGDEWPALRQKVMDADILVVGTPIWMGQPSSVVKRVLERMDAFLGETDDAGRMPSYGKVAIVAVVGNEDGAHHVSAELYQALNDVGFSLAPNAVTYWVGEAMQGTDYKDKEPRPEATANATAMAVRNAVHLAARLQGTEFPGG
ncbi:MAG: flavodoxin family protein [Actinomycetota bacterium]